MWCLLSNIYNYCCPEKFPNSSCGNSFQSSYFFWLNNSAINTTAALDLALALTWAWCWWGMIGKKSLSRFCFLAVYLSFLTLIRPSRSTIIVHTISEDTCGRKSNGGCNEGPFSPIWLSLLVFQSSMSNQGYGAQEQQPAAGSYTSPEKNYPKNPTS